MKHLKTYKIFEGYIKHDINDILLELEDEGNLIVITNRFVRIRKPNPDLSSDSIFTYREVGDAVERLLHFLDDHFKKITFHIRKKTRDRDSYYTFPKPEPKIPFWKWVDKTPPEPKEPPKIDIDKVIPDSVKRWIIIKEIKIEYEYPDLGWNR